MLYIYAYIYIYMHFKMISVKIRDLIRGLLIFLLSRVSHNHNRLTSSNKIVVWLVEKESLCIRYYY